MKNFQDREQETAAARTALPSPTSTCWVFSCFSNPPNSDMDYRIFNARSLYTCTPTASQHNIFDSGKLNSLRFACASDGTRTWVSSAWNINLD